MQNNFVPQPQRHWTMSTDIFLFSQLMGGVLEGKDAAKHPKMHRTTSHTTKNYVAQNGSCWGWESLAI